MLPVNFSLNAVLILLLGGVFLIGGVYFIMNPWMRILGLGMLSTAVGCICCGFTDGFTDATPRGQMFKKVGAVAFIIGVPVLVYSSYKVL